ncbi:MAG: hypothetical protein KAG53_10990 [Endozoicomonadaceae bacterium]|nr:hypothetical protein [Endozoicomonadaceae bacterium]
MNVSNNYFPPSVSQKQSSGSEHTQLDSVATHRMVPTDMEDSKLPQPRPEIRERTIKPDYNVNADENESPRTIEDIRMQLEAKGYCAVENDFNEIALGIDYNDAVALDDFTCSSHEAIYGAAGSSHANEKTFDMDATINRGVPSWKHDEEERYPDNILKIINKILENINKIIPEDHLGVRMAGYHNNSSIKPGIGYHQDYWPYTADPSYLIFCVIQLKHGTTMEREVTSHLGLGFVHSDNKDDYSALLADITPAYDKVLMIDNPDDIADAEMKSLTKNRVIHLKSIEDITGSGYVINQKTGGICILHSRELNEELSSRTSLVFRIFSENDLNVTKEFTTQDVKSMRIFQKKLSDTHWSDKTQSD